MNALAQLASLRHKIERCPVFEEVTKHPSSQIKATVFGEMTGSTGRRLHLTKMAKDGPEWTGRAQRRCKLRMPSVKIIG